MRWVVEVSAPAGPPVRIAGMAGGMCTARSHAAAAIAAAARDLAAGDAALNITTRVGRRRVQFTAAPRLHQDLQYLVGLLERAHVDGVAGIDGTGPDAAQPD